MKPDTPKRCAECRFCLWERVDTDDPQWPRCDNSATKVFDYPIEWLHPDSHACSLFEKRATSVEARIRSSSLRREVLGAADFHERPLPTKRFSILGQVAELAAMGVAGAGMSNLDKGLGIAAFGVGLSSAVIIFVIRNVWPLQ